MLTLWRAAPRLCAGYLTPQRAALPVPPTPDHPLLSPPPSSLTIITPINVSRLTAYLANYDPLLRQFLLHGFSHGFSLGFMGARKALLTKNHGSLLRIASVARQMIAEELSAGRACGPFPAPPFVNFRVSPLGLIPKKAHNKFRLIHDLSSPAGDSVNDFIPDSYATVSYFTVDDAVNIIKGLGRGCFLAKTDIQHAFKLVPVRPADFPLLGFMLDGSYFFDKTLPMGARCSCFIFQRFGAALRFIHDRGPQSFHTIFVIDDFLFLEKLHTQCGASLASFLTLAGELGVPIATDKTVVPTTCLTFLGIEIDTQAMELRLPSDKLHACRAALRHLLGRSRVTLRELQRVIGLLNFACRAVVPGRAFLRRLIDLTVGVSKPFHHIRLSASSKADLRTWLTFLTNFNGRCLFLSDCFDSPFVCHLRTDAAGARGYGALCGDSWFAGV